MRNGYILSGSKWHTQNISFWRLQIFCLCSLFCFEQNQDTFLFVFAGSKLCTILVILFRVLLVTKVNNLPRYCAAQSAKPNLEVLSRTRTKARFFLLFTVLFSTILSISSSVMSVASFLLLLLYLSQYSVFSVSSESFWVCYALCASIYAISTLFPPSIFSTQTTSRAETYMKQEKWSYGTR